MSWDMYTPYDPDSFGKIRKLFQYVVRYFFLRMQSINKALDIIDH